MSHDCQNENARGVCAFVGHRLTVDSRQRAAGGAEILASLLSSAMRPIGMRRWQRPPTTLDLSPRLCRRRGLTWSGRVISTASPFERPFAIFSIRHRRPARTCRRLSISPAAACNITATTILCRSTRRSTATPTCRSMRCAFRLRPCTGADVGQGPHHRARCGARQPVCLARVAACSGTSPGRSGAWRIDRFQCVAGHPSGSNLTLGARA